MQEDDGDAANKKHRDMFAGQGQKFTIRNIFFGAGLSDSDDDSDDSEEESEDEGQAMEFDVMKNQNYFSNAFNFRHHNQFGKRKIVRGGLFGNPYNSMHNHNALE